MKLLVLVLLTLVAGISLSCSNQKKAVEGDKKQVKICVSMDLLEMPLDSVRMDPINIDSLNINGDCLDVFVSYGGIRLNLGSDKNARILYKTDQ